MRKRCLTIGPAAELQIVKHKGAIKSISLIALMLLSSFASIQFFAVDASASSTDQDGDGLTYGLEYLINSFPNDPDSDNDGLPDGWEWKYGLNPLSSANDDGAVGDPDGDGMSNLQEYTYLMPSGWDNPSTPNFLDNGIWWNGTVPVNDWNEEDSMQYLRPLCGDNGADGEGNTILCDEDPVGNICANGFDDDKDGLVDSADPDGDGDADCFSNDDDGDGLIDEDVSGWDTDGDGMPDGWEAANGLNATSASNADGPNGDPDGDGLNNLLEYVNPTWDSMCGSVPCFRNGPNGDVTETVSPCDPVMQIGPGGCATYTAEVDGITSTSPQRADSDNDGLNDSYEALVLLTDPTSSDTDSDGIPDGVEVNGLYGNPPQASDPRDNNTDDDEIDDGEEDNNSNGVIDPGETDPTRKEDSGDEDQDGLQNWEENLSCTLWNVADSDFGGVNDGDELNVTHGTDPCDSFVNFETNIVNWNSGSSLLSLQDPSGFNPDGGDAWYNQSGVLTLFTYSSVNSNELVGVSTGPTPGVTQVVNQNGSFCHTEAVALGTISTSQNYCDDDYEDSDGDGLADWEEILGVYGWFSNPSLVDTDSDGVSDFDEVFDFTDPNEPCINLLDDDFDGLNNYFETSVGCDLIWIGIANGSQDLWLTDTQLFDTDSGGVDDRTEYFDGTNPESDPLDDILPEDFDGDGIPDGIENLTGTDWTNPDTDGGGMIDGDECPPELWSTGCLNSQFNPFDPTDDIVQDGVVFWANNSSGAVDLSNIQRWRLNTNDFYTGTTYAHLADIHPFGQILQSQSNFTGLPDSSFSNGSVIWDLTYFSPITRGNVPIPSNYNNITFWSDPASTLQQSNETRNIRMGIGEIDSLNVIQDEYFFDWATISSNVIIDSNENYTLIVPEEFIIDPFELELNNVTSIVQTLIQSSQSNDPYTVAQTISDFLREGNVSTEFKRFNTPIQFGSGEDVTEFVLDNNYGRCSDFNAAFVTMARIAGIPARYVNGYAGGDWNGNGYTVTTEHYSTWGEVKLNLDLGNNVLDLGWIPFDSCPEPEEIEIVNQTFTPLIFDRELSDDINLTGQLRFLENQTTIPNYELGIYLSPFNDGEFDQVTTNSYFIDSVITDLSGNFSINSSLLEPPLPGLYSLSVIHNASGFIATGSIAFENYMNITDDSVITHTNPSAVNVPIVGAGSSTNIQGSVALENIPQDYNVDQEDQLIWISYDSSVNGSNNISGLISPSGLWSVEIELDVTENIGIIPAKIWYGGWVENVTNTGLVSVTNHIRPSSLNISFDIREAPNLTASVEGPLFNNSFLIVGQDYWINGTAVTAGSNPVDMEGDLVLSIRKLGSFSSWTELLNTTVNGSFSIPQNLQSSVAQVEAGEVELQLRFFPFSIDTTDDANLSVNDPYILRSNLSFQFDTVPTLRGSLCTFSVSVFDHRGVQLNFVEGDFAIYFNGSWVTTEINSSSSIISSFGLDSNLVAGDYDLSIQFNGSDIYSLSQGDTLQRVKGGIGWNFVLGNDWTHIGNTTYINGTIYDEIYLTPILGDNQTSYTITMITSTGNIVDIAQGNVDNQTSSFNQTITMPTTFNSSAYVFEISFGFINDVDGNPFYASADAIIDPVTGNVTSQPQPDLLVGIESEYVVTATDTIRTILTALTNSQFNITGRVTDIADSSNLPNVEIEVFFDSNNSNLSMGTVQTNNRGVFILNWNAIGIAPGEYEVMIIAVDNNTYPLIEGNSRYTGNWTTVIIKVQANTDIRIDSAPSSITAGLDFNILGQVIDAEDNNRLLISPVALKANWLGNENESLLESYLTTKNGTFNLTLPTDTANNGTIRGAKTLVISVIEGSSELYLQSSIQTSIFVFGVTQFDSIQPLNAIVVNRGDDVNISAQLVESSNRFLPLSGYDVSYDFGGNNIGLVTTDSGGFANITHNIPLNQSLGLTTVDITFLGSSDLLSTTSTFSSINVRSLTFIVIDNIAANPVAGEEFNVSGKVTSDNGSGLEQVDGTVLPASILFEINSESIGFTVSGASVGVGGYWNATILLSPNFARGNNTINAAYIPAVNFYLGSNTSTQFDSKGFTEIRFVEPASDDFGQPTLEDRVERGNNLSIELILLDNTGTSVEGQLVTISLIGTQINAILTTDENGLASGNLTIPNDMDVGLTEVNAIYSGLPGSIGLLGSQSNSTFMTLARTNVTITQYSESLIAGDYIVVNGTLLDDLGVVLKSEGVPSSSVIHLMIDGVSVASVETNATTGNFSVGYTLPDSISAGIHSITIEFFGGRNWVEPIGIGEPSNPEFYMPSSASVPFNVSVPTQIDLLTANGDVNREDIMTIEGLLLDVVDNPLSNFNVEVWLDGDFMTNVTTDSSGLFTAIYPVPADAELGPVLLEIRFTGTTFYLPSQSNGSWNIFSHIIVDVAIPETIAVGQNVTISGSIADNQLIPITGHQVDLIIEGITITSVTTDQNGEFSYDWLVNDLFEFGNNTLVAYSESQGYYRANSSNTSFFLAHRSDMTVSFETNYQVTRGDTWEISGRLFDIDSSTNEGLENEDLVIFLDGQQYSTVQTGSNGEWDAVILASLDLSRGQHQIEIVFQGTLSHIGTNQSLVSVVWSDLNVSIDPTSSTNGIRSDGTFGPITISGTISEIGGTNEIFENLVLNIGNGSDCVNQREGARCIPSSMVDITWLNGDFIIETVAPSWYGYGSQYIHLDVLENNSLYLNSASVSKSIFIKLNVDYQWNIAEVEESGNKDISGSITILANDTGEGVPFISVTYILKNESNGQITAPLTVATDPSGVAEFKFNSDPPYGDYDRWGYVTVDVQIVDPIISENSKKEFESLRSSEEFNPKYKFDEEEAYVPGWVYVVLVILTVLIGAGIIVYRKRNKNQLLEDAAEVFAYTAELLAAGDSIREAIFNCYQSLCSVLQQNGFLRRDFETVREFEVAIRQAMPQISDDALLALDNMFEMARYSRDELGGQHQQAAQLALDKMVQELASLTAIPNR